MARPFRILLLGDFTGRASRGISEPALAGRKPVLVDRDNFDDVLAKLSPELQLPHATLKFTDIDDFHPDRLYATVPAFQVLREMRSRLSDRSTFAAAAAELQPPAAPVRETSPRPGGAPELAPDTLSGLLDQMVAEAEPVARGAQPTRGLDDLHALVREMVAPYLEPKPDPKQAEMVAQVDRAVSGEMRALLHNRYFQELEAAWRGLFFLIRRLETGVDLKLYILDVSKPELRDSDELERLIVDKSVGTPGAELWSVLAGNYTFGSGDIDMLARIARMAGKAGAAFVAGAAPELVGAESVADLPDARRWHAPPGGDWAELRHSAAARHVGLALPRFLLRLPYGRKTDSLESFDFEEMPGTPRHEDYLWANPAIACAYLLGQGLGPDGPRDIESLPAHTYEVDGETEIKPCAEVLLTENAAVRMLEAGLMPLLSYKNSDRMRLARFQSISDPVTPLAGRWSW